MKSYSKGKIAQVVFGSGSSKSLVNQVQGFNAKHCLIVSDSRMIDHELTKNAMRALKESNIEIDVYSEVNSEPTDEMCLYIGKQIKEQMYDCVIGIGGGSPMDAAKAGCMIAGIDEEIEDLHQYGKTGTKMKESYKRPCALILMPTTSGTGAETTASAVISSVKHGIKFSFGNRNTSCDLCVIDPEYTLGMPAMPTVNGGLDAISHIVEIVVGTMANDYTNTILFDCLERVWKYLPIAVKNPMNLEAREQLSYAAHNALANGGMPNGHAVSHALGSIYHIVHGQACIMVLPTVIRHFANDSSEAISKIGQIMNLDMNDNAQENADKVADCLIAYYKQFGVKSFSEFREDKGITDTFEEFTEKMIPAILDDFKSREWMPAIHTGDYKSKISKVCEMIYNER